MLERRICGGFAAASVVMAALFTGYWIAGRGHALQPVTPVRTQSEAQALVKAPFVPVAEPEPEKVDAPPLPDYQEAAADMDGSHIFLYDPDRWEMLWCSADGLEPMYPASVTKLYTAYIALMHLDPGQLVTAGEELSLVRPGSSTAYIARGHVLTVEMLIEAMLLPSGNDAAYVLAAAAGREIAGNPDLGPQDAVAVFVEEMNRVSYRLGLLNSWFVNPDGYHHEDHVSCPQDVALFTALALEEPVIARYACLEADAVVFESGQIITWYNTNRLVNPSSDCYCPEAVGGKTGHTDEAGYCLVAAFRQGESRLVVGIFGGEEPISRYRDAVALWETYKQAGN